MQKLLCQPDFDDMDLDGSGDLSYDEVKKYLAGDGGVSDEEVAKLLKEYDKDEDGTVSLVEFLQCMGYKLK